MKKFLFLVLTFCFVLNFSFAGQVIPEPSRPRPMVNDSGNLLSDTYPMPVKLMAVGTSSESLDTVSSTTSKIIGDTSALITPLNGRNFLTVQNVGTQTVYINFGGATATTADYQIFASGEVSYKDLSGATVCSIVCGSGATSTVVIVQGKK